LREERSFSDRASRTARRRPNPTTVRHSGRTKAAISTIREGKGGRVWNVGVGFENSMPCLKGKKKKRRNWKAAGEEGRMTFGI